MFRLLCALFAILSVASATDFRNCSTLFNRPVGKPPLSIEIDGCPETPCTFVRGTNISGAMNFLADTELTLLKPEVTVYVFGVPINFPISETDACNSLTVNQCPVGPGEEARYEYSMLLPDTIPVIQPVMRYAFRSQKGQVVICAEVPLSITAKPASTEAPEAAVTELATTPVAVNDPATTPEPVTTSTPNPSTTPEAVTDPSTTPEPEPAVVPSLKTIIQVRDALAASVPCTIQYQLSDQNDDVAFCCEFDGDVIDPETP